MLSKAYQRVRRMFVAQLRDCKFEPGGWGSESSGRRAFQFNKLAVILFFALCHSVPFASAKVFDPGCAQFQAKITLV
jgi:hypothetical protein